MLNYYLAGITGQGPFIMNKPYSLINKKIVISYQAHRYELEDDQNQKYDPT